MIEFGAYRYDSESRLLYRGDQEILLPPRVVAVLESLLKRPGKIVAAARGRITQPLAPAPRRPRGTAVRTARQRQPGLGSRFFS